MRPFRYNNRKLRKFRRLLRKNQTRHESILWEHLQKRRLLGYKFRRQYSVDYMILDFYCPKVKLAVELDGRHHKEADNLKRDRFRDKYLMEEFGIYTLRIENYVIDQDIDRALKQIIRCIESIQAGKSSLPKVDLGS